MFQAFSVYFVPEMKQMKPVKSKYLVVLDVILEHGYCFGVVIDSRVHHGAKPENLPCFVPISPHDYSFLRHDSQVSCNHIHTVPFHDFAVPTNKLFELNPFDIAAVLTSIQVCPLINLKHKLRFAELYPIQNTGNSNQ